MRYAARFEGSTRSDSIVVIHASNGVVQRSHPRPLYTMTEAAQTAQWLNERAKGYPRNSKLDHLYNGRG